jgi:hypothetical protein
MQLRLLSVLAFLSVLALAGPTAAVIIDSGDGTGNTTAPSPDPGWHSVGTVVASGHTAVHVGAGWVLTANHVGPGDTRFDGVVYPWAPGTDIRLHNPDASLADLVIFHLQPPYPPLPTLPISSTSPLLTTPLVMIGNGRDRGAATSWDPSPGGPPSAIAGYYVLLTASKRWGTNFVEDVNAELFEGPDMLGTKLFGDQFDQSGIGHSTHESVVVTGDSGGAAFAWNGSSYELAGILIAELTFSGQPSDKVVYGNGALAADLSFYRNEILDTLPEPNGGLWAGAALVSVLASAETRRAGRGTRCAGSSPPGA